jgi:hypothetical protein
VVLYLLKEDGGRITLEDGSGSLILEASGIPGPTVDWQAGGAGYPVKKKRRNETEELFRKIEHSLEVALGLVPEPSEVTAGTESTPALQEPAAWSEEAYRDAIHRISSTLQHTAESTRRLERLHSLLRAYEEAKERERIEEEEAWILMA